MRYIKIGIALLFCVLFFSCGDASNTNVPLESAEDATQSGMETLVLDDQSTVYVSDYEQYGAEIAKIYYWVRTEGDPDWYKNSIPYHDGQDISFQLNPAGYSTKDELWSLRISSISDSVEIAEYNTNLNIEKQVQGVWERACVLEWVHRYEKGMNQIYPDLLTHMEFSLPVAKIYPEVTPGQYRFVFYVVVECDGKTENRMYYIPFEVVE